MCNIKLLIQLTIALFQASKFPVWRTDAILTRIWRKDGGYLRLAAARSAREHACTRVRSYTFRRAHARASCIIKS